MQNDLLFFSAVDKGYQMFIIPYIYFASKYNKNASFEFIVKGLTKQFKQNFENFKNVFQIKNAIIYDYDSKISANKLRFLVQPNTKCQYTYIGDVDIFINQEILNFHLSNLQKFDTIYDNQIRIGTNRLSGLHFVKTKQWYEITKNIRNYFLNNSHYLSDQQILYYVCQIPNIKMISQANSTQEFFQLRPSHGLHVSLSRTPFTDKMKFPSKLFRSMFMNDFLKSDDFNKLKYFLSKQFLNVLKICQNYVKETLL